MSTLNLLFIGLPLPFFSCGVVYDRIVLRESGAVFRKNQCVFSKKQQKNDNDQSANNGNPNQTQCGYHAAAVREATQKRLEH
jgi:hypothetical protein